MLKQIMKRESFLISSHLHQQKIAQRKPNNFSTKHQPAEWNSDPQCSEYVSAVLAQLSGFSL